MPGTKGLADKIWVMDVRGLRQEDLRDGGHDLSPLTHPDLDLVRRGVVELDETFVSGRSTGRMGASTGKVPVMVAVERIGSHKLGRVRFGIDYAPGSLELVAFARRTIAPGSTISTDGARMLRRLGPLGYTHKYTTTSPSNTCPTTSTNTLSASTAATPKLAACCSTDSSNKP